MAIDYTNLSLRDIESALDGSARDIGATFGRFDARQLNWRHDPQQWSVAQCLDHLLSANRLMFDAAENALSGATPPTIWQRLPMLSRRLGHALIRSQAPGSTRRYKTPAKAHPSGTMLTPRSCRLRGFPREAEPALGLPARQADPRAPGTRRAFSTGGGFFFPDLIRR
jgi:hypothetical protein